MIETKNTFSGTILSHCPISEEIAAAAEDCFLAYTALNEKVEKLKKTLPEGFAIKNFYGKGDCVRIESKKDLEEEAKYWEEHS